MFRNLKITVTAVLGQDLIGHETVDMHGDTLRRVASLQDQVVRDQLLAAGWAPPGALELARREEEPLILRLLVALSRSSPNTDITRSWKQEQWRNMRTEAIAAARARLADAQGPTRQGRKP